MFTCFNQFLRAALPYIKFCSSSYTLNIMTESLGLVKTASRLLYIEC